MEWEAVKRVLMYALPAAVAGAVGYAVYKLARPPAPPRPPEVKLKPPAKPPEVKPPRPPREEVERRERLAREIARHVKEEGVPEELAEEYGKVRALPGGVRLSRYQAWVQTIGGVARTVGVIRDLVAESKLSWAKHHYNIMKRDMLAFKRMLEQQYRAGMLSREEYEKLTRMIDETLKRAEEYLREKPEKVRKKVERALRRRRVRRFTRILHRVPRAVLRAEVEREVYRH